VGKLLTRVDPLYNSSMGPVRLLKTKHMMIAAAVCSAIFFALFAIAQASGGLNLLVFFARSASGALSVLLAAFCSARARRSIVNRRYSEANIAILIAIALLCGAICVIVYKYAWPAVWLVCTIIIVFARISKINPHG
jgi:hypothetical protein